MDDVQRMTIEHLCARLIHRYAYCIDQHDFTAAAELFAEDAIVEGPQPGATYVGRQAILDHYRARIAPPMRHLYLNILVEVVDGRHATSQSTIMLLIGDADAAQPVPLLRREPPAIGLCTDTFGLTDDGWKFTKRNGALTFR